MLFRSNNDPKPQQEVREVKSQRQLQLEYLMQGTAHTLEEANIVAQKCYKAKSFEDLSNGQFGELYDRLQNKIKEEKQGVK